nr:hypothetical protein [Candidatus Cloacimonadota bacterium]
MKKTIFIVLLGCLGAMLVAAPHSFLPVVLQQPDGSSIEIFASGDEYHNWLHDKDNYSIIQNDQGWYVYAAPDGEGVKATDLIVGRDLPSQRSLQPGVNLSSRKIQERYDRMSSMRDYSNGRAPHQGQLNNLVVFIRFADDPPFGNTIAFYESIFNDDSPNANSMKNFFGAASYGQLEVDSFYYPEPDGDLILTYIDSHPRNYYRKQTSANPIGYNENNYNDRTQREHTLLANAINYIADDIPMTLDLDGDDDGYVDNVCFIIQGATDGWAELLWPHRWVLYSASAYIHGAQVWDFNFQLENSLNSSGASVLSHEMFHSLGAPDLYRYNDNTINPIGSWDLMSSNTNPPQHMSAWMKYRYGQWIDSVPWITESGTYTLYPVASSATNNIYRIQSWRSNESFVLEYRKPEGLYDTTLPGQGLLVYRLNNSLEGNADGPPDELYIYRPGANNTTTNGMLSQAAFSAQNLRMTMTQNTIPSGFTSINTPGGLYLYNVGYAGDTITFDIRITDVQLTHPIGGETWFSGTDREISWVSRISSGTVKLEFSADAGANWQLIADGVPNSGSYTWNNVPMVNSEECKVRITLNSNGNMDTSMYTFNIISSMYVPQTIYPTSQEEGVPTNPIFTWDEVPGALGYNFQLSRDPGFNNLAISLVDHPTPFYQASGLVPFTAYYWRVASRGEIGSSGFSDPIQFTTGALSEVASVPILLIPPNYALNLPLNPEVSWQPSYLAESYNLQIAENPFFTDLVVEMNELQQTSITSPLLSPNTTYYWRVMAQNSYGNSDYSNARRFTTGDWVSDDDALSPILQNKLNQNYPNPFNPDTYISFELKDPMEPTSLVIYNLKGQVVRRLFSGIPGTTHMNLRWDGKDENSNLVGSGIYLYRLQSGAYTQTRKMLLSK